MMFQKPPLDTTMNYREETRTDTDDVETVVGPSVHVEGDFSSAGNILVKGMVSGTVHTSKRLTVESGAKILANVKAGTGVISGEIKGNVKVSDRLEIMGTARIAGDIECQTLVVEAGALLYGKVMMKGIEIDAPKAGRRLGLRKGKGEDESEAIPEIMDAVAI